MRNVSQKVAVNKPLIKKRMTELGVSYEDLGEFCGYSETTIRKGVSEGKMMPEIAEGVCDCLYLEEGEFYV